MFLTTQMPQHRHQHWIMFIAHFYSVQCTHTCNKNPSILFRWSGSSMLVFLLTSFVTVQNAAPSQPMLYRQHVCECKEQTKSLLRPRTLLHLEGEHN